MLRPGGHLVVSDTRGLFIGSGRYPLVMKTADGRVGYLPTWRHGIGAYVRTALAHGFDICALEQPEREPMDDGDWEPPELPDPLGAVGLLGLDALRADRDRGGVPRYDGPGGVGLPPR